MWFNDSSAFIMETYQAHEEGVLRDFRIYSRDGELLDLINSQIILTYNVFFDLSPNNQQFAYLYPAYESDENPLLERLYIADLDNREILDTCIKAESFAWSQDSRQIAIMPSSEGQRPVLILDLDDWRLYETGLYHGGKSIFWRAD